MGAFNVNKWCRLMYPGHEMLGAYGKDSSSSSSSSRSRRQRLESLSSSHRNRLQFIDPDGAVKTLHVPFHLALTSKNSRRAEDLHLLKTFKSMMKGKFDATRCSQIWERLMLWRNLALRKETKNVDEKKPGENGCCLLFDLPMESVCCLI